MPALITHYLFGAEVVHDLPQELVATDAEVNAFLLGNQGPDPFLARHLAWPNHSLACNRLHRRMHAGHIVDAFLSIRDGVSRLPQSDMPAGRAFALGLLAHYALDRIVHPFVYSQQDALIEAEPSLKNAYRELHPIIETDLDSYLLWHMRHTTVETFPPAEVLEAVESTKHVGGALFSQVALQVFDLNVGVGEYEKALQDYARIYHTVERTDPKYTTKLPDVLYKTEKFMRPSNNSYVAAMAHRIVMTEDFPTANLKRLPWKEPYTGEIKTESILDLMDEAREFYRELVQATILGQRITLEELIDGINYMGKPVVEMVDDED